MYSAFRYLKVPPVVPKYQISLGISSSADYVPAVVTGDVQCQNNVSICVAIFYPQGFRYECSAHKCCFGMLSCGLTCGDLTFQRPSAVTRWTLRMCSTCCMPTTRWPASSTTRLSPTSHGRHCCEARQHGYECSVNQTLLCEMCVAFLVG